MDKTSKNNNRKLFTQKIGELIFRLWGWKLEGSLPNIPKYVMVGAPHTTNWDWVVMIILKLISGENLSWIGKDSLFRFPFGRLMRRLGGIPVVRKERTNFVDQIANQFSQQDHLIVCITPEGTRGRTTTWKTGFYYIAYKAQVPIVLASVDYPTKTLEIGPNFLPAGNLSDDSDILRKFYQGKSGKYPEKHGEINFTSNSLV